MGERRLGPISEQTEEGDYGRGGVPYNQHEYSVEQLDDCDYDAQDMSHPGLNPAQNTYEQEEYVSHPYPTQSSDPRRADVGEAPARVGHRVGKGMVAGHLEDDDSTYAERVNVRYV